MIPIFMKQAVVISYFHDVETNILILFPVLYFCFYPLSLISSIIKGNHFIPRLTADETEKNYYYRIIIRTQHLKQ